MRVQWVFSQAREAPKRCLGPRFVDGRSLNDEYSPASSDDIAGNDCHILSSSFYHELHIPEKRLGASNIQFFF